MGATKKYPSKLTKRKRACIENGEEDERQTAQEHTISGHAVLFCKYFM